MSQSPTQVVTAFLGAWAGGKDALRQSFVDYMTDDIVYENVDLTHTTTREDAQKLIETFLEGLDHITIEMLAIVEKDHQVLTERVDHLRNKKGDILSSIRVMGIFDVKDERISGWRDYFDMRPFAPA